MVLGCYIYIYIYIYIPIYIFPGPQYIHTYIYNISGPGRGNRVAAGRQLRMEDGEEEGKGREGRRSDATGEELSEM